MLLVRAKSFRKKNKEFKTALITFYITTEISQHLQENTCARIPFFDKVAGLSLQLYQKRDCGTGAFL